MRLQGLALRAARRLAESAAGGRLVRQKVFHDYGIDELLALPASCRRPLYIHAGPLEQQSRRGWPGADLAPPSPPSDRMTVAGLQSAFQGGETTPSEVLDDIFERIDDAEFGPATFSPFRCLDRDRATRAARQSTQRYGADEARSALDGIPVPVKDHFAMQDLQTFAGGCHPVDEPDGDAHLIDALRGAGALLYAKTHTTEWGMDPCGYSPHVSMPRNAYDCNHAAGGSSTGSAACVAAGLAPVAVGSDGGGSIRIPAALNGLFGLKPTFVRIGRSGDSFAANSVSVSGPIGASTADVVEFMAATATVDDPDDPARRWGPDQRNLGERWRRAMSRGVDGCRIAIPTAQWDALDEPLQQPSLDALRRLEDDGAELVDVDIPLLDHAPAIGVLTIGMETLANLQDLYADRAATFGESLRMTLAMLRTVDHAPVIAARRTRAALRHILRDTLDDVDLLALPTTRTTAPRYSVDLDGVDITDDGALRDMTRFTFLANITGLPAGTVPVGRHDGLPFGLQFVGGAWDEASIIAAMAHAERQGWAPLHAVR